MNDVDSSVKEFDVDGSGYACWIVYDWKIGGTKITLEREEKYMYYQDDRHLPVLYSV